MVCLLCVTGSVHKQIVAVTCALVCCTVRLVAVTCAFGECTVQHSVASRTASTSMHNTCDRHCA